MVLLEYDGAEALLLQDVMTRRTQRHVWDECKRDGLVLMMTAANGGAPSRPLSPRTRAGTTHATPPLNAIHPSSDVQVILMRVDSLPAGVSTCNVDMKQAQWRICTGKISFHTIPSKTKVVVFSDELQGNKNAAGYMQASWGTLHKIYMTRKQSHINIDILIVLVAAYHNWHQMIVAMKIIDCKELNKKLLYMLLM